MVTEDEVYKIENEKKFNGVIVRRRNMEMLQVLREGDEFILFEGESDEVADFLNEQ